MWGMGVKELLWQDEVCMKKVGWLMLALIIKVEVGYMVRKIRS